MSCHAPACALHSRVSLPAQLVEPHSRVSLPALTHPAWFLQYKCLVDTQWQTSAADPLVTDLQVGTVTAAGMLKRRACCCSGAGQGLPETQTHCSDLLDNPWHPGCRQGCSTISEWQPITRRSTGAGALAGQTFALLAILMPGR